MGLSGFGGWCKISDFRLPLELRSILKCSRTTRFYREDPKVSRWVFGGREDRGVTGCPFGSRRSTPDPS